MRERRLYLQNLMEEISGEGSKRITMFRQQSLSQDRFVFLTQVLQTSPSIAQQIRYQKGQFKALLIIQAGIAGSFIFGFQIGIGDFPCAA